MRFRDHEEIAASARYGRLDDAQRDQSPAENTPAKSLDDVCGDLGRVIVGWLAAIIVIELLAQFLESHT